MWKFKTGKVAHHHQKSTLPPTDEAFMENVRRCYLQVAIWKSALL